MSIGDRPKVLIVVTAAITARLFMKGYAEFLSESGYDVTLVADDLTEVEAAMATHGVSTYSLPMRRDPSPLHDLRSLVRMFALMRRLRPDAVIYATPKASMLASIAGRVLHIPVRIYELWGIRFETATGLARKILRGIERLTASGSTAVVANSESLARQAVALGITTSERISVPASGSSHGVDAVRFAPTAPRPELDAETAHFLANNPGITIGFVGRLHPDKGIDVLLAAAERVHSDARPLRIILVGGSEGFAAPREGQVPIHLVGETEDVRSYIAEFDVLVLMSRREGFPNVVLEAGAMQVPAIVSDATGCVDAVVDQVTGIVVPVGDIDQLVRALTFFNDEGGSEKMGKAARTRALEEFSPVRVWGAKEDHLHKNLDRADRSSPANATKPSS